MPPLPCLYSVGRQCVVCHWPYSPTKGERLVICPVIRRDLGTTRPGAGNGTAGGKASLRRWLPGFLALLALAWLALGGSDERRVGKECVVRVDRGGRRII